MKRRQKAGFGKPDKLQNHSNEGKGKEKNKARRRKGGEEKKAMVLLLVAIMATLEILWPKKNCWTEKVHLAITFSKIRLDGPAGDTAI